MKPPETKGDIVFEGPGGYSAPIDRNVIGNTDGSKLQPICLVRCAWMLKCGVVHSCEAVAFWFSLLACRACGRMWQLGIKETKHSSWVMLSRGFWRMCASTSIKIRSLPVRGFPAHLHCLEAVNVSGQTCPSSTAADYNKRLQFIPQVRTGKITILYSQILSFCLFCSLHLQLFLFYRTNLWILALHNQYCVFNGSPNDQYIYINTHFIYCRIGVNRFGIFRADTKTDYYLLK